MADQPNNTVQTVTSDATPNQLPEPDQQSPSLFAQLMANSVNNSGQQPSQQPGQTLPPQTQPPTSEQVQQTKDAALETHPANQKAKLLYKIGETLAGGPQIKTTYHEDGSVTREKVPLTTKQVITGALANILGSVGQVSDNLSARMQGRAPKPIAPLPTQQAAAAQAQQTDADFERIQTQRVRQAKIINANLEGLRAAYALSMEDDEAKKQAVANHADELDNWQKAGAVEATNVPSDELLKRGFDKSKYIFIPDGIVPAIKPDGTRATNSQGVPLSMTTYSVVDGTTQAKLSQDKYDQFAKYGLMQAREGFTLPEGATISSAQLALMNNKLSLIQQTQRELDRLHDAVGGDKVDLATEIKKNPKLLSAIEQFHNTNAGEDDPVKLLQAMAASNNPKVKGAVGTMAALFGQQNLDKWIARNQQPPNKMSVEDARQIVGDPRTDKNSPAYKTAQNVLAGIKQEEIDKENRKEQSAEDRDQRKQDAKDRSTMGYVEDQSGKTYYVSKYDSENNPQYSAQSFNEVKPSDLAKDKQVIRPLSDVQMNINHYRTATNAYESATQNGRISPAQAKSDRDNLTTIFSAPDVANAATAHVGAQGFGISVPTLSADLNAGLAKKVTNAYNALSPEGKAMADNYVRARAAIPAWVKALTNSGRGSKEQLEIELQNLLPPYYGTRDIHNRLDGFQDNLDNQTATLPQNLLGRSIPSAVTRGAQPQNAAPAQKGNVAPEGTIVNTENGQMIKRGGQWVAYQGQQ